MIHQVTYYQTLPHVDDQRLDQMMIATRVSLVRIPEISVVRCGKNVDPASPWRFFVALDSDNLDRLERAEKDMGYVKFLSEVVSPNVSEQFIVKFEMEPGKSGRLS